LPASNGPWLAAVSGDCDSGEAKRDAACCVVEKRRSLLRLEKSEARFAASPSEGSLLQFGTSPGQNAPRAGAIPPRRDAACCVSGMRFAASPAESQIRWRSSASQPTRMARAKVSRSECHVGDDVTGRPGPVSSQPICGASRGLDEVKLERQRLPPQPDRPAMDEPDTGGTRGSDFARSRTGPARDSGSDAASLATTGHGDAASPPRKRRRCNEAGREAIPDMLPATPGPAK
jgi:hypothetical protein